MSVNEIDELTASFRNAFQVLGRDAERDRRVVVTSTSCVPPEIVRAAGLEPVVARGGLIATPAADAELEPQIFPSRLRNLVDAALTGRLAHVAAIVIPRTSDPDYKCFLYLREFARRGIGPPLPPILLFDLLLSDNSEVPGYDVERGRELFERLAALAGTDASTEALRDEIGRANAARAAARRIDALRRRPPRLCGIEAFELQGAFWQLPPAHYAALAGPAADQIAARAPFSGARILLAGAPVDTSDLHAMIESHAGIVVAEISAFGGPVIGEDVAAGEDVMRALIEHYRTHSIGARTPVDVLRRRIDACLDDVDAVVVSSPPYDAVFGWDYPALRETLERRSIPHTVLRSEPGLGPIAGEDEALCRLVATAAARRAVGHG
jgi:benzoyl-CoA reductase/2-hydroxyglutaryl-CoA dehydratase subunit BcrC/BadD/HgdB